MGLRVLFDRAFSREQEFEADRTAVAFCARAGYAYQATWDASPEDYRVAIETGVIPEPDAE